VPADWPCPEDDLGCLRIRRTLPGSRFPRSAGMSDSGPIIEYMTEVLIRDKPAFNTDLIPCPSEDPAVMPVEHLEARICELAGHLTAATYQFLLLIAGFDARQGWAAWEMPSCAAWLSWKCQIASGTAPRARPRRPRPARVPADPRRGAGRPGTAQAHLADRRRQGLRVHRVPAARSRAVVLQAIRAAPGAPATPSAVAGLPRHPNPPTDSQTGVR
jgi:hypothetical protein